MNKEHIAQQYKKIAPNFMTPDIKESVQTTDNRIIELSTGFDMDNQKIWGVTEFEVIDGRLETTRRGQMHRSAKSARKHFNILLGAF